LKQKILNLQKSIFKQLKLKSQLISGEMSKEFKRYERGYLKEVYNREFKESHHQLIINKIKKSNFSFVGDFHTFDQSQRNFLRILKQISKKSQPFTIGLEIFKSKYQNFINAYLDNYITENELLESTNYYAEWPFPWAHYRDILILAKEKNLKVLALNSSGDLYSRDEHAAHILSENFKESNQIIISLFGELHLSESHLPGYFQKDQICIVHQHLDSIYWSLQERALKNSIVAFNPHEFCLVTSPPWLKYQSMINWYETLDDEPTSDYREYIIRTGLKNVKSNANDLFLNLIHDAYNFLGIQKNLNQLENFEVHDYNKFDYINLRIKELDQEKNQIFYEKLLASNYSFKIWDSNDYYCSEYTNKKMTSLVGFHLFYSILESTNYNYKEVILKGSSKDRFAFFFFQFFWGYLVSKLFNPHTKCDLYKDLYLKNQNFAMSLNDRNIVASSLDILEEDEWIKSRRSHNFKLYQIAKILGEFCCEFYYNKMIDNPNSLKELVSKYLEVPPSYDLFLKIRSKSFPNKSYKLSKKRTF